MASGLAKGELPAGLVERDVRHGGSGCASRDRTDARDRRQSATGIAGAVPRHDPLLDPCDLASDSAQLIDEAVQRDRNNLLDGRLLDGMLRSMTSSWRDDGVAGAVHPSLPQQLCEMGHTRPQRPYLRNSSSPE